MVNLEKIPPHIIEQYGSTRAFKTAARVRAKNVERAYNRLRAGSAFFPNYAFVHEVGEKIKEIRRQLSVREWGR